MWSSQNTNWTKPLAGAAAAAAAPPIVGRGVETPTTLNPHERGRESVRATLRKLIADDDFADAREDLKRALSLVNEHEDLERDLDDRSASCLEFKRAFENTQRELDRVCEEMAADKAEIERQLREIEQLTEDLDREPDTFRLSFSLFEKGQSNYSPKYAQKMEAFSGVKTPKIFRALFDCIDRGKGFAQQLTRYYAERVTDAPTNRAGAKRKLAPIDGMLATLFVVRTGATKELTSRLFDISDATLGREFDMWIRAIVILKRKRFPLPTVEQSRACTPGSYVKDYGHGITWFLDATELQMEVASDPWVAGTCWSDYKQRYTLKFLGALHISGGLLWVSAAYPGKITDNDITQVSSLCAHVLYVVMRAAYRCVHMCVCMYACRDDRKRKSAVCVFDF